MEKNDFHLGLQFAAFGTFFGVYQPSDSSRLPQFRYDYLGGQFGIEVQPDELTGVPSVGESFGIKGKVRVNFYNSSVSLIPESKIKMPELTMEQYIQGLRIFGLGVVSLKNLSSMGRQTYLKTAIKFQGGQYLFNQLTPELYQKVPSVGQGVRFECGIVPYNEKNQTGQTVTLQKLQLLKVQFEQLSLAPSAPSSPSSVSSGPSARRAG